MRKILVLIALASVMFTATAQEVQPPEDPNLREVDRSPGDMSNQSLALTFEDVLIRFDEDRDGSHDIEEFRSAINAWRDDDISIREADAVGESRKRNLDYRKYIYEYTEYSNERFTREFQQLLINFDRDEDDEIGETDLQYAHRQWVSGEIDGRKLDIVFAAWQRGFNYGQYIQPSGFQSQEIDDIEQFSVNNQGLLERFDADDDGKIGDSDISGAVEEWRNDNLRTEELRTLVDAWGITDSSYDYRDYASINAEVGERVSVSVGQTVEFGDQNQIEINDIRREPGSENIFFEFTPGIGAGVSSEDLTIVIPEDKSSNFAREIGFNSGKFDVTVADVDIEQQNATLELTRYYSQSSNFECESYDLQENQYAFCNNTGEEAEREVDLGTTTQNFDFVRNYPRLVTGQDFRSSLFSAGELSLDVRHDQPIEYRGAEIEIIEWRGLDSEHDGRNMQTIIEVDPATEQPEASLNFDKSVYTTEEPVEVSMTFGEPGTYRAEFVGAGISKELSFDGESEEASITLDPEFSGDLSGRIIAPGNRWNPFNNDKVVAEKGITVQEPENPYEALEANHIKDNIGGKVTGIEEKTEVRFGNSNQYSLFIENIDYSSEYPEITGYIGSVDESNRFSFDQVYDGGLLSKELNYGSNKYLLYLCASSTGENGLDVGLQKNEDRAAPSCDPKFEGSKSSYNYREYSLGEVTSLSEGSALEWGNNNQLLLESTSTSGTHDSIYGYANQINSLQSLSTVAGFKQDRYFYDGKYWIQLCGVGSNSATLLISDEETSASQCPEEEQSPRDDSYENIKYTPGERQTIADNTLLEFGSNKLYVDEVSESEGALNLNAETGTGDLMGYSEIIIDVGGSTEAEFSQDSYEIGVCSVDSGISDIVIERADDVETPWPESYCEDEADREFEEGDSVTYYMEFDVSDIDEDGRIKMADGFSTADADEDIVGRSGVLEVGETYNAEYRQDGEVLYSREVVARPPGELNYNEDVNQPILEIEFDPEDDVPEEGQTGDSGFEIVTESPFGVDEQIEIQASANQRLAESGYSIVVEGPESFESDMSGQSSSFEFTPERPGEYVVSMNPTGGILSSLYSSLTGSDSIQSETIVVESDRPVWRDFCARQDYSTDTSGLLSCIQSEIIPAYFEDSVGDNPRIADSMCQGLIGLRYSEEDRRCQ